MAATILDGDVFPTSAATFLVSTTVNQCQEDVMNLVVGLDNSCGSNYHSVICQASVTPTPSVQIQTVVDEEGYVRPFGLPQDRHQATVDAIRLVDIQKNRIQECSSNLLTLSEVNDVDTIQTTLSRTEADIVNIMKRLNGITRPAALDVAHQAKDMVAAVQESLLVWRSKFPDTSPVKINNGEFSTFTLPATSNNC